MDGARKTKEPNRIDRLRGRDLQRKLEASK